MYSTTVLVKACIIKKNMIGFQGGDVNILNCLIDSNNYGIYNVSGNIIGNSITHNYIGIYNPTFGNPATISKNVIQYDTIGIQTNRFSDSIFCNLISNNINYNIETSSLITNNSIDLTNNYWGTTDTALISAMIYDGNDSPGISLINFFPIDSSQCYLSPCNLIVSESTINATCPTCADGRSTAHAFNGFPPYTYEWNSTPPQTLVTAVNLLPGQYTLCITDVYGCSACDTFMVNSGNCSAYFNFYPDTVPHYYLIQNLAHGSGALTYSWDWGDGSPNDVIAAPSHTYASPGFYTICSTITDAMGCVNTYCNTYNVQRTTNSMVYVNVIQGTATGILTNTLIDFIIYPNPANDYINIILPERSKSEITIYNIIGEVEYASITNTIESKVNIANLKSGIYFIELKSGNKVERKKFQKL